MTDNEIISLLWKVENGHILTNHEQEMLYKKKHLNWSVDEGQNPSIPESIICLRNLESLSVRDTGIYMLPESIGMLKNLKYLNLQNTYISKLPITFRNLNKLITLNLRGTKISTLDGIIGNFDNLQNLDLSETSITKLPDEIANLKNLRQLSLRDTLIVDLPQCVGELDKLHVLNLWNTQINELPDSIKRLTRLQTLDLRQTNIRELPHWIDCLKNLRKLRLWSTQISEFPEEIGNLEQLSSLDFSRTQVKELPDTLKNLTNLQKLHFNNTQIAELPSSIRELKNLRFLNLSRTQVSELPDFLGQLSNLQSLNIAATPINELPDTIGKLTSLESLNLKKTQITELPEFLKNLRNLRMLGLGELPLKKLPNWIVNFKHLRELYIWKTNISELPEWITELNNLRGLDVSCTSISVLPESLYKLSKLRYLDLSNTLISSLPNSIGTLSNLKWLILEKLTLIELPESLLYLHLNYVNEKYQQPKITGIFINELKLKKQPISLFYQNRGLIIDYYHQNHLDINETKIIFLGDEGVGKTHTIKRILNNNHKIVEPLSETPGISITSKDFFTDKISYRINFWDFGGQEIMHAMHRCFLTDRTGYVVVVSTRFGDLNKQARYWLKNIDSFTKNAPIVIYVNIWNDGTLYELNQSSLRKDYPNIVTIKQCSAKDDDDISFSAITNAIQNMALTNDSISMSFPSSWENIRQRIIDIGKKEPKRYYISQKDFRNECYKNGIIDEGIQTWLLNWFNDLGECFSYQFEECMVTNQDLKILNPEWLTNAIYIIIREAGDLAINGFVSHKGIRNKLDHSDKGTLKDVSYTAAECNYILEIMRKFRLSYKVSGQDIEFIPALLRDNTPSDLDFNSEAISYEMRYENLPENVIHNLMIMMYPYLDYQKCWCRHRM